jgi:hypothetical protein
LDSLAGLWLVIVLAAVLSAVRCSALTHGACWPLPFDAVLRCTRCTTARVVGVFSAATRGVFVVACLAMFSSVGCRPSGMAMIVRYQGKILIPDFGKPNQFVN